MKKMNNPSLIWCIVDVNKGTKVLKVARKAGALGCTVFHGKGTLSNRLLNLLGLSESRKEVCIITIEEDLEKDVYIALDEKFELTRKGTGVLFSMNLQTMISYAFSGSVLTEKEQGDKTMVVDAIFIIVNDNQGDDIVSIAKLHGATGGTIIHARGAGSDETLRLFNMELEPEKEIVLILSKHERTSGIVDGINKTFQIDTKGKGVIFVVETSKSLGLYQD